GVLAAGAFRALRGWTPGRGRRRRRGRRAPPAGRGSGAVRPRRQPRRPGGGFSRDHPRSAAEGGRVMHAIVTQPVDARRHPLLRSYVLEAKYEFLRLLRTPIFSLPTLLFPVMFYLLFAVAMNRGAGAT